MSIDAVLFPFGLNQFGVANTVFFRLFFLFQITLKFSLFLIGLNRATSCWVEFSIFNFRFQASHALHQQLHAYSQSSDFFVWAENCWFVISFFSFKVLFSVIILEQTFSLCLLFVQTCLAWCTSKIICKISCLQIWKCFQIHSENDKPFWCISCSGKWFGLFDLIIHERSRDHLRIVMY